MSDIKCKIISITFPEDQLEELTNDAKSLGYSRSKLILEMWNVWRKYKDSVTSEES